MTTTAPAPRLMAPSRDDVLSNLSFFFGEPVSPEKLRDYSEQHATTFHFPDAYYGQNSKIRDTLNNLILNSPQEWQTNVALPFVRIEGTTVEWDELRFDVRLLQRVPYEGVSRMQTSLRRRYRDRVVRRGIGMTIESDFYATDVGRQHFRDQLTSIRFCVQETCNFDCLYAYLTCTNYDFRYDMSKGLRPRRQVRQAMAHEISMYGIVQKEKLGFDKAVEDVKYRMSRYQVTPNMLIVPPQLLLYLAVGDEGKIRFIEGGDRAVAKFEEGMAGYEARAFRGMGVFTTMPFEVSDDSDSVQLLQRSSQVGEFYRMCRPDVLPGPDKKLPPSHMDLLIYDEEADQLRHISFMNALKNCGVGTTALLRECLFGGDAGKESAFDKMAAAMGSNLKASDIDEAAIKQALVNGEPLPIAITICRPFIEHHMMSAIATVSGRDTGMMLFGPADMQIAANTSVKTIEGHYTCHTKAAITKPQNVCVMRDIMCTGYVAGGNTKFFGEKSGDVRGDVSDRLTFANEDTEDYASMFAFLHVYDETKTGQNVTSISDRVLPWEIGGTSVGVATQTIENHFPGGPVAYKFYRKNWGLDQVHYGEDAQSAASMSFIAAGAVNNATCFLGPHRKYNPFAQNFFELVPGQGHFGPDAISGDARWRRGESVSQSAARDHLVGVEAAAQSQMKFSMRDSVL